MYHHGDTGDLAVVINRALQERYEDIVLLGYSMGGSMSIKYLGERKNHHSAIKGSVVFSVPCNLRNSAEQLELRENRIYEKRFLKKVKEKMLLKASVLPDEIDVQGLEEISDFNSFHERYTVPLHGFHSIDDFYDQSTCDQFIPQLGHPVLVVNAKNDPLLGIKCYPFDLARESKHFFLETPAVGGHVGFTSAVGKYSWMEQRAMDFIKEVIL
jgi:hypothetical protein